MKVKLIGIFVCMLLIGTVLPTSGMVMNGITKLNKSDSNPLITGDFNVEVTIIPGRRILPRFYLKGEFTLFRVSVFNMGPDISDECTVDVEIIKLIGENSGTHYSSEIEFGSYPPSNGHGSVIYHACGSYGLLGIYRLQATSDIIDNNLDDNSASFIFFVLDF